MQPGHPFFDRYHLAQFQSAPGRPLVIDQRGAGARITRRFPGKLYRPKLLPFRLLPECSRRAQSRRAQSQKEQSIIRQQVAG
jgi:hypothetical protein